MSKVILNFSVSLDGYAAGPEVSATEPMGIGGERLHEWMFNGSQNVEQAKVGAVVLGRRTYDLGVPHWGGDTPYPAPSFVVTHRAEPKRQMKTNAFTFVTDGVESAVAQARALGSGDILIMGPSIAQQALAASLVDQIELQLVPVLLGGGTRLFDHLGEDQIELGLGALRQSPGVTHFTFTVPK
jgi:dihydrofolate reductase